MTAFIKAEGEGVFTVTVNDETVVVSGDAVATFVEEVDTCVKSHAENLKRWVDDKSFDPWNVEFGLTGFAQKVTPNELVRLHILIEFVKGGGVEALQAEKDKREAYLRKFTERFSALMGERNKGM